MDIILLCMTKISTYSGFIWWVLTFRYVSNIWGFLSNIPRSCRSSCFFWLIADCLHKWRLWDALGPPLAHNNIDSQLQKWNVQSYLPTSFSRICKQVSTNVKNKLMFLGLVLELSLCRVFWETSFKCFWDVWKTSLKSSHWDSVAPSGETCLLIIILLPPLVQHCLKTLPILGLT